MIFRLIILYLLCLPIGSFAQSFEGWQHNILTKILLNQNDLFTAKEQLIDSPQLKGSIVMLSSSDSSLIKIKERYNVGESGQGDFVYYLQNDRLIYSETLIVDHLIKGKNDTLSYVTIERKHFFHSQLYGKEYERKKYSESLDEAVVNLNNLGDINYHKSDLDSIDYNNSIRKLKKLLESLN